jgi:uncharacterized membrane protein (DUF4010 family)
LDWTIYRELAIAAGLGLLVGLQREWTQQEVAGIRTFALITIFGTVSGLVGALLTSSGPMLIGAGMLAVAALMVMMNVSRLRGSEEHPGPTTEVAALVMFGVGVLLALQQTGPAVCIGGATAVLLQWKKPMHDFVHRIGDSDMRAIFRLALIALVVLPVLPDRAYGPYDVLNPFHIWLMVVLIVGISVSGYMAYKFLGARAGTVLGGVLGGVISSTATTVSYSRRTRNAPESAPLTALVIMIASTIVFLRVGLEVILVAPGTATAVLPPLGATMLLMTAICVVLYMRRPSEGAAISADGDPSALKTAIVFGALYALVIFTLAAVKEHFGQPGTYLVAVLSGLTDMDAITLSTARLIETGRIDAGAGWRMILLGGLSNIVFKGFVVAALGHRRLMLRVVPIFGITVAGGVAILLLWPG